MQASTSGARGGQVGGTAGGTQALEDTEFYGCLSHCLCLGPECPSSSAEWVFLFTGEAGRGDMVSSGSQSHSHPTEWHQAPLERN